jgi:hypothetical protein
MTTGAEAKQASWMIEDMLAEKERVKQAADRMAASAQAEAERIKAKLPLPLAASEGMFEVRFVQALVEIMTGRATVAKPDMVKMPETPYEQIALVLSSTGQFYYRVTPQGCTCKGFVYRGKCRHFKAAFPELVVQREDGNCSESSLGGRQVKAPSQKSKVGRKNMESIPALANSKRVKEYEEYLQNDYAAHRVHEFHPMDYKNFCRAARRLEKIQARLKALGDASQWDCQKYKDLEREEHRYCLSLGY